MKVIIHDGKVTIPSKDFEGKEQELAEKLGITTYILADEAPFDTQGNILKQIYLLEKQITKRRIREAIISGDASFIENIENQIETLRSQL